MASRTNQILEDDLAFLETASAEAEFWGIKWKGNIGWQPQREKSIYHINNPRTSRLNRIAEQLEARIERSLTGMDASEADSLLGRIFKKQVDEEGYPILEGLTNETLDIGQLARARDSLQALADRTGDVEVRIALEAVNEMFENGKILDNFGNEVPENISSSLRNTWESLNDATNTYRRIESRLSSNPLFQRNEAGEFINTDLKTLGNLMKNGSKFRQHMRPWMHGNPQATQTVQDALMTIYRDTVLSGTGFTASKHATFLRNYDVALKEVFSEADLRTFRNTHFDPKGRNILVERAERSRRIMNRLANYGEMRAGSLVDDLTAIGNKSGSPRKRTRMYMQELERANPGLAAQVRADSLEEVRRMINDRFFGDAAANNPVKHAEVFKNWIDEREHALRALHGDQYVTDLRSIWRGMHLDTQRFRIAASKPELQGDVVRTSRTLMGPLNVWQRRVSAFNWLRWRHTAKKASAVISEPDKLRQLNVAKGIPIRSRPGIAVLARIGILPGTGWDGEGELPDDVYEKGIQFVDWLASVQDELEASDEAK